MSVLIIKIECEACEVCVVVLLTKKEMSVWSLEACKISLRRYFHVSREFIGGTVLSSPSSKPAFLQQSQQVSSPAPNDGKETSKVFY